MTRPLLGLTQLMDAVANLHFFACDAGVSIALVGGLAMNLYGSDRLTADVDIIAERRIPALIRRKPLAFGGHTSVINDVPTDVIIRVDDYAALYEEALVQAMPRADCPIRVVTPEFLLAMKLASGRAKDEQDIAYLLTSRVVDVPKARAVIRTYLGAYAAHDFDSVVSEVEWKQTRGLL